jgi:hypothetical protein
VDIDGVRTFTDFEVIEIVDDNFPYPSLLGIDWAFDNSTVVDLKKIHMIFERDVVITPRNHSLIVEGCNLGNLKYQ